MSEVAKSLAAIMGELGPINKDERNREQGFDFRSIEAITDRARPLFAKHNVTVIPHRVVSVESSEVTAKSGARGFRTVVTVEYLFVSGVDGSTLTASMVGEAVDYGDKSTSKAVQMAYKYALTEGLMVGSGSDPDSHSPDVGGAEPPKRQRTSPQQSRRQRQPEPKPEAKSEAPGSSAEEQEFSRRKANKLKLELLQWMEGNETKAKVIWRETVALYGYASDDLIKLEDFEGIEADLRVHATQQEEVERVDYQPGEEPFTLEQEAAE